jgi:Asp-tRNA(Asn)/Glu-tRNA(Gln) amidotransferase A subunit family amidase
VNAVAEDAIRNMSEAGATLVRISIPGLDRLTRNIQVAEYETKIAFDNYLTSLGSRAPVKTMDEFIAGGGFHSSLRAGLEADARVSDGLNDPEYKNRLLRRNDLRQAVMNAIAVNELDAILYPHQRRLVVPIGEDQVERNGVLSNSTGFPALTFPGGFSRPTPSAPLGVPVGIEILGPDYSEPTLIAIAFAFEQVVRPRRPPASTPPLAR